MKSKYQKLIDNVVQYVGGENNISYFTHCVTRLRFNIKDKSKVQEKEINQCPGVMGSQWSGDQFQIIIGQAVADVFNAIIKQNDLHIEGAIAVNESKKGTFKFSIGLIFESLAAILSPLIPLLVTAGMIKVVVILGESFGWLSATSPTTIVLSFASDAGFYFLPIFVGSAAAKRFGADSGLGMLVGAILIHPTFISLVTKGTALSVFGLPIYSTNYSSTIFPTIIAVWVMSYIEKFIAKHSPESIRSITEPVITILLMIPLSLVIIAPIGAFLGTYLVKIVLWLYHTAGFLSVALLATILPFVIMTGMHTAFVPYLMQMYAKMKYEPIFMPASIVSNLNQGIACLVVAIKAKDKSLRSTALSCAIAALLGGVTEPGMFGVTLKLKTPMYGAMIGSFFGGLYVGITHTYNYAMGNGGLLGLTTYVGSSPNNLLNVCIGVGIGMIITFIATFILYKGNSIGEEIAAVENSEVIENV